MVIADLVESSRKVIQKTATGKGLEFHCEASPGVPLQLTGDRYRISQILLNLLANAVKFTPRGSVVMRLSRAAEGGREWLDFAVTDTGVGIPADQLDLMFQPFTQADSTLHRPYEGAGLGLAISLQLAKSMAGSIRVISTPGHGSTFTLRLPIGSECPPA